MEPMRCGSDEREVDHDNTNLNVGDPALRKTRLLTRQCDTCIFRPGNPMWLEPGRLRGMVDQARTSSGYIVCHSTLPYYQAGTQPAICRGFTDRYTTWQLHAIGRLWGFVEVEPPASTEGGSRSGDVCTT